MNKYRIDQEIRSSKVKVIQDNKEVLLLTLFEALELAKSQQKNLVELSYNNGISICKIMDYKKHIYQLQKKKKLEQKKVQQINTVKIIAFKVRIGENDLSIKLKNARKFLLENKQVKLVLQLLGRDMAKPESIASGLQLLQNSIDELSDIAKIRTDGRKKNQRDQFVILVKL